MSDEKVERTLNDLSIIELKAALFDLDQEIRVRQDYQQTVGNILQEKINAQKKENE